MKTMQGAFCWACWNRSRTRAAPTPTNISTNSEPGEREERHPGLAGGGPGEQGLARARRPHQQHALGNASAQAPVLLRRLQELDDLLQLLHRLVDAGHVLEGHPGVRLHVDAGPRLAEGHHARRTLPDLAGHPAHHPRPEQQPDARWARSRPRTGRPSLPPKPRRTGRPPSRWWARGRRRRRGSGWPRTGIACSPFSLSCWAAAAGLGIAADPVRPDDDPLERPLADHLLELRVGDAVYTHVLEGAEQEDRQRDRAPARPLARPVASAAGLPIRGPRSPRCPCDFLSSATSPSLAPSQAICARPGPGHPGRLAMHPAWSPESPVRPPARGRMGPITRAGASRRVCGSRGRPHPGRASPDQPASGRVKAGAYRPSSLAMLFSSAGGNSYSSSSSGRTQRWSATRMCRSGPRVRRQRYTQKSMS